MDLENKYGTLYAQQRLLELAKCFHSFCEKNMIRYSLSYGSLLGAIRHNGFIPWDDDLDVCVDRKNYNKLIDAIEKEKNLCIERDTKTTLWIDRVRLQSSVEGEGNGHYYPTLDIFVLDNAPQNRLVRSLKFLLILALQGMMKQRITLNKGSFGLKLCSIATFILGKVVPIKWKCSWYRSVSQIGNRREAKMLINYNGEYSDLNKSYPVDMMQSIVLHPFEDTFLPVVEDYDLCLTTQYGNYMVAPKEEDRIPRHVQY